MGMQSKRRHSGARGLGLGLLLLFFMGDRDSQAFIRMGELYWPASEATLTLAFGCPKEEICWDDVAEEAVEEWNRAGANFRFQVKWADEGEQMDPCDINDGVNTVGWGLCMKVLAGIDFREDTTTGEILESILFFNPKTQATGTRAGFYKVMLHELGHVVGLDHSNIRGTSMRHAKRDHPHLGRLHEDDIAGVKAIYGGVEVSAREVMLGRGEAGEYRVRLTRAPAGPVTVTPGSGDANLVTVSGAVTFTARNWQTWQAVRVTGVDVGQAVELPQEVPLTHQVTGSEGVAVAGPVLPVTLHAAEGGGEAITLPFPGGQTVDLRVTPREVELAEGSMKYYRLWPTSEPPGVVSIRRVNLTPDVVGLVYQRTLRIKPDSWQAGDYYTLRLKAGQDAIAQGSRVGRVVHRVSLDGWTLIGLRVQATVTDDDTAGVVVSKEEVAVAEGATAQYEVRLTSEPAGPVTVTPGSGDASRATVSGALTFDATNWRTPQAVTVTGVDDGVAQGTRTVRVTHTVVGYGAGVPAAAVTVTVQDNDRAALPVVVPAGGGARKGDWAYCTVDRPCGVGAGDCDHDGECQPGLTCVDNTGPQQYGLSPQIDVCVTAQNP